MGGSEQGRSQAADGAAVLFLDCRGEERCRVHVERTAPIEGVYGALVDHLRAGRPSVEVPF